MVEQGITEIKNRLDAEIFRLIKPGKNPQITRVRRAPVV
jgi:hypothetical protein